MSEHEQTYGKDFLIEQLSKIPHVKSLKREYIENILHASTIQTYSTSDIIIPEGSCEQWVYVLLTGSVSIRKGRKELTSFNHIGDIFGELAIISNDIRTASVVALSPTVCLAIDLELIQNKVETERNAINAAIYRLFSEILTSRLKDMNQENFVLQNKLDRLSDFRKAQE